MFEVGDENGTDEDEVAELNEVADGGNPEEAVDWEEEGVGEVGDWLAESIGGRGRSS